MIPLKFQGAEDGAGGPESAAEFGLQIGFDADFGVGAGHGIGPAGIHAEEEGSVGPGEGEVLLDFQEAAATEKQGVTGEEAELLGRMREADLNPEGVEPRLREGGGGRIRAGRRGAGPRQQKQRQEQNSCRSENEKKVSEGGASHESGDGGMSAFTIAFTLCRIISA